MTTLTEFHKFDGLGLAELVRTRQVAPADLVEEAISVGRFGDEATLSRLAGQVERAQPWFDRDSKGF